MKNLTERAIRFLEQEEVISEGNMSYVRFENTLDALHDCFKHMEDPLTGSEFKSRHELIDLCERIAEKFAEKKDSFKEEEKEDEDDE